MLIILACTSALLGQNQVVIGEKLTFRSDVLGEDWEIYVASPPDDPGSKERYPVLYLLDAESHFRYASSAVEFLASADRIPRMIVVGIASGSREHRSRDLTPTSSSEVDRRFTPAHGGAARFLTFLTKELMPMVETKYPTRPYRILAGHSHGGLFATYAFAENPTLFQAYLAFDPSLSWDKGAVGDRVGATIAGKKSLRADFFVAAAHSGEQLDRHIARLVATFRERSPAGFRLHFDWMKQETHMSIPLRALPQGLEQVFDKWHLTNPLELYTKGGIAAIHEHFRSGGERYGYDRTTSPFTVSMVVAELIWKGNLEEASRALLHDEKQYPPPWNQLDALARAYADRGNNERAIHFYRESLKVNPGNDWAKRKLKEMSQ
jgi:predicted alpha/beta superfamily hydrolase